jgi:hypothetical protein
MGVIYQKLPSDVNINIFQPCDVHDRVDMIRGWLEYHFSSTATPLKGADNCRSIIRCIGSGSRDDTSMPRLWAGRYDDCGRQKT